MLYICLFIETLTVNLQSETELHLEVNKHHDEVIHSHDIHIEQQQIQQLQ